MLAPTEQEQNQDASLRSQAFMQGGVSCISVSCWLGQMEIAPERWSQGPRVLHQQSTTIRSVYLGCNRV